MAQTEAKLAAAIVGASGYAGTELTGLLLRHPNVELKHLFVSEKSADAGKAISEIDARLTGRTTLKLEPLADPAVVAKDLNLVFLATDHAVSATLAPAFNDAGCIVFDLSGAYRLANPADYPKYYGFEHAAPEYLKKAVYSLGEFVDIAELKKTNLVSLPGCYPTASQLALKPLIGAGLLDETVKPVIDAVSGISGAGRKAKLSSAFCEVSLSAYGVFTHRHRPEIEEHLGRRVIFTPHLGSFKRGILATITARLSPAATGTCAREKIEAAYRAAYAKKPLVRLRAGLPKLDDVTHLPFCDIGFTTDGEDVIIISAIDNLLKGASAQAVQVMNLKFGFHETTALL